VGSPKVKQPHDRSSRGTYGSRKGIVGADADHEPVSRNDNMKTMTPDDIKARIRENFKHHFKVSDAKRYGITEAILLYNLKFWLGKNKAKGKHQYNGRTWTFNSQKAFSKLFPYLSESQIKRALASLVKQGAILKDNFNKKRYDRTNWYALADESQLSIASRKRSDEVIHHNGRVHPLERTISSISSDDRVPPIPDTKTQILKLR
jgi:hypothetical protein